MSPIRDSASPKRTARSLSPHQEGDVLSLHPNWDDPLLREHLRDSADQLNDDSAEPVDEFEEEQEQPDPYICSLSQMYEILFKTLPTEFLPTDSPLRLCLKRKAPRVRI